ncbi:hypothetical protein ACOMHN_025403 [Nucella lapillus]
METEDRPQIHSNRQKGRDRVWHRRPPTGYSNRSQPDRLPGPSSHQPKDDAYEISQPSIRNQRQAYFNSAHHLKHGYMDRRSEGRYGVLTSSRDSGKPENQELLFMKTLNGDQLFQGIGPTMKWLKNSRHQDTGGMYFSKTNTAECPRLLWIEKD